MILPLIAPTTMAQTVPQKGEGLPREREERVQHPFDEIMADLDKTPADPGQEEPETAILEDSDAVDPERLTAAEGDIDALPEADLSSGREGRLPDEHMDRATPLGGDASHHEAGRGILPEAPTEPFEGKASEIKATVAQGVPSEELQRVDRMSPLRADSTPALIDASRAKTRGLTGEAVHVQLGNESKRDAPLPHMGMKSMADNAHPHLLGTSRNRQVGVSEDLVKALPQSSAEAETLRSGLVAATQADVQAKVLAHANAVPGSKATHLFEPPEDRAETRSLREVRAETVRSEVSNATAPSGHVASPPVQAPSIATSPAILPTNKEDRAFQVTSETMVETKLGARGALDAMASPPMTHVNGVALAGRPVLMQIVQATPQPGQNAVEITLSPEELGRVRLTLTSVDGTLTLTLSADRAETLDLLRRHSSELGQEYLALGYTDIDFQFQQNGSDPETDPGADTSVASADGTVAEASPSPIEAPIMVRAGLDIRL